MIPEAKKSYLELVGFTPERIATIEAELGTKAQKAAAAGLEQKETKVEPPAAPPVEAKKEEPEVVKPEDQPVTRGEFVGAMTEVLKPVVDTIAGIQADMKQVKKSDDDKIKQQVAAIPAVSLSGLVLKNLSAVGKLATEVKDGETIKGPLEAKDEKSVTGIPWIDEMLTKPK